MEKRVLLTNVPEALDEWSLKNLTPCGDLIVSVGANPKDNSMVIVEAQSREDALKIATELNEFQFLETIINARCVVPPTAPPGPGCLSSTASQSSSSSVISLDNNGSSVSGSQDRIQKFLDSAVRNDPRLLEPSKVAPAGPVVGLTTGPRLRHHSVENLIPATAVAKVNRNLEKTLTVYPRRCRFCLRSEHRTWDCVEYAEYYSVSKTEEGKNPSGISWPDSAKHKILGLHAGPVIEYFEHNFFQQELTRHQLTVLFAFIANRRVCFNCGAGGHIDTEYHYSRQYCDYLPLAEPATPVILQERKAFAKRVFGVRKTVGGFREMQSLAFQVSTAFRHKFRHNSSNGVPFTSPVPATTPHASLPEPKRIKLAVPVARERPKFPPVLPPVDPSVDLDVQNPPNSTASCSTITITSSDDDSAESLFTGPWDTTAVAEAWEMMKKDSVLVDALDENNFESGKTENVRLPPGQLNVAAISTENDKQNDQL